VWGADLRAGIVYGFVRTRPELGAPDDSDLRVGGKVLRILCNNLDASAGEIAELYKRRWAIELFFRWVKQTLKIRRFLGTSENAVRIQIAVALIAFLLLRLAQAAQHTINSPLVFARLIRANLMHRRRPDRLLEPEPPPNFNTLQLALQWNHS
jgi:IS4 transposase